MASEAEEELFIIPEMMTRGCSSDELHNEEVNLRIR